MIQQRVAPLVRLRLFGCQGGDVVEGGGELFDEVDIFVNDVIGAFDRDWRGGATASGDDEDADIGQSRTITNFPNKKSAGQFRHHQVGDDEGRGQVFEKEECFHSIAGALDLKSAVFKEAANGVPDEQGIVDDEGGLMHEVAKFS